MKLTDDVLRNLRIGRVFKEVQSGDDGQAPLVNSLDMHLSSDLMVTAGASDASINLYDIAEGKHLSTTHSQKYGCAHIRFTHHDKSVLYASSRGDDHALRYHSLHDNKYIRYFHGHSARVTGLAFSSVNDMVLSCAEDRTARIWDLRARQATGVMKDCKVNPTAAFDYQGMIFAVSSVPGAIKLFDMREYQEGEFLTIHVGEEVVGTTPFSHLAFSFDGKHILAVAESNIYVMDAFDGRAIAKVNTGVPEFQAPPKACFTPEGTCIVSGCEDGLVRIWKLPLGDAGGQGGNAKVLAELKGHAGKPMAVQFSTRRLAMASVCHAAALWVPDVYAMQRDGTLQGVL